MVVRVKERREPDLEFFAKHKDEQVRQLERQKWAEVVDTWAKQRCVEARDEGRLRVNDEVLAYEPAGGEKQGESKYQPCGTARP